MQGKWWLHDKSGSLIMFRKAIFKKNRKKLKLLGSFFPNLDSDHVPCVNPYYQPGNSYLYNMVQEPKFRVLASDARGLVLS